MLSSEQVRAARALLRWEQKHLADASGISLPSIKRLEIQPGELAAQSRTVEAIQAALENAGIAFIADGATSSAAGPGVRLRDQQG
jgi:predicted transcriptional regulator